MVRAIDLAKSFGMSAVTLMNTNHGCELGILDGSADAGASEFVFTIYPLPNMPCYGKEVKDQTLEINPLVNRYSRESFGS